MTNIEFPKKVSDTPKSAASETKPMEMILFLFKFLTPFIKLFYLSYLCLPFQTYFTQLLK